MSGIDTENLVIVVTRFFLVKKKKPKSWCFCLDYRRRTLILVLWSSLIGYIMNKFSSGVPKVSDFSGTRHIGLDIARSIAIVLVLFSHARYLVGEPGTYFFLTIGAKFGVELFFVLSGFLIGTILLKSFDSGINSSSLFRFWVRRWLRTLPAYFSVLLFVWVIFDEVNFFYFFFLQDLVLGNWNLMPVSWSLVIEEWFYLMFPLLVIGFSFFYPRSAFLLSALFLCCLSIVYPMQEYFSCSNNVDSLSCFENEVRKSTFRFGSLGIGVLIAYMQHRLDLRSAMNRRIKTLFFCLLISLLLVTLFSYQVASGNILDGASTVLYFCIFYPLMGFVAGLTIIFLFSIDLKFPIVPLKLISFVSITSYSNYLWHMLVFDYLKTWKGEIDSEYLVLAFFSVSFFVAGLSYLIIEKPFLTLRNKVAS
ncbi:MAG: hypothetical protein CMQ40_08410 [Gammaproteobacteria bacterium]|nr:hypothetical protein [Gammaproteobacteria bacterium]